jgi:hypothetical protein
MPNSQEKAEGLIKLPESSTIIKPILEFCYSGKYVEDVDDASAEKAVHGAKVYVTADKYDIRAMGRIVYDKVLDHFELCLNELYAHAREVRAARRRAAAGENMGSIEVALDEVTIAQHKKAWDAVLSTIEVLLEGCGHDEYIRALIRFVDWPIIVIDAYRADWTAFVASHPSYAAELILKLSSEECQLQMVKMKAELEIANFKTDDGQRDEAGADALRAELAVAEPWINARLQRLSEN